MSNITTLSWKYNGTKLEEVIKKIEPTAVLHAQDTIISKIIAWTLFLLSFGLFKRDRFLNHFAITLGNHIFIPENWTYRQALKVSIHEAQHIKQFKKFGLGIHPLVGVVPMGIVYLFLPLPFICAFGRLFLEIDADKVKWRYLLTNHWWHAEEVLADATRRAVSVSGINYFLAVPRFLSTYFYKRTAKRILDEHYTI